VATPPSCAPTRLKCSIIETSREEDRWGVVVRADHGHELEPRTVVRGDADADAGRARAVPGRTRTSALLRHDLDRRQPAALPERRACAERPLDIGRTRDRRRHAGQQQAVSVEKRIAGPYVREVALIWSRSYEASSYRWYFEGFARWLDLTFKR